MNLDCRIDLEFDLTKFASELSVSFIMRKNSVRSFGDYQLSPEITFELLSFILIRCFRTNLTVP